MPTYDYVCKQCGYKFEVFQRMSDKHVKNCPNCAGDDVKRLIGAGSTPIFKGSGFYQTDYKNNKSSPAAKSEPKTSAPVPVPDSKTESKPAPKPDPKPDSNPKA